MTAWTHRRLRVVAANQAALAVDGDLLSKAERIESPTTTRRCTLPW
jgi:hypothetical protein